MPRKSMAQRAAEARGKGGSWSCPHCGCSDWRVPSGAWLRKEDLAKRRKVRCRHCGYETHTAEYIEHDDVEQLKKSESPPKIVSLPADAGIAFVPMLPIAAADGDGKDK
jgi:hypothetical protein